ncbi:unnamed protein product, partial [Polarella glacialis]
AKTPCYEVSEEEFERLLAAGALDGGGAVEDGEEVGEFYEISEEEFDRLYQAGQVSPAQEDAPRSASNSSEQQRPASNNISSNNSSAPRPASNSSSSVRGFVSGARRLQPSVVDKEAAGSRRPMPPPAPGNPKPPPSTAPAASIRCPDLATRRRRRPQTVDLGQEIKGKVASGGGLFFPPTDGAFFAGEGECSFWSEVPDRPLAAKLLLSPSAAGSPLQSARLLRGLKASGAASLQSSMPESEASSSSSAPWQGEEGHPSFARRRPMGVPRTQPGRTLPRLSQRSSQQSSVTSPSFVKSNLVAVKRGLEGDDDDILEKEREWSDGRVDSRRSPRMLTPLTSCLTHSFES